MWLKEKFKTKIIRETRSFSNYWASIPVYTRTVVYTLEWDGTKTNLFTYIKVQDHIYPIYFHLQPWDTTAGCLDMCRKPQLIGYRLNYWGIQEFQWLDEQAYKKLKENI